MLDPSVQDIAQLKQDKALKVWEGDETRIIMIALDQARDELLFSDVKGKNPVQGQARASGAVSRHRHQRDPEAGHARPLQPDRHSAAGPEG